MAILYIHVISTVSLLEVSMSSVTGKLRANDSC